MQKYHCYQNPHDSERLDLQLCYCLHSINALCLGIQPLAEITTLYKSCSKILDEAAEGHDERVCDWKDTLQEYAISSHQASVYMVNSQLYVLLFVLFLLFCTVRARARA